MSRIIICPICDEELGNSIDEIPEKCPICDTRKHEITQEIEAREQDIAGIKNDPQLIIDGSKSTIISVDSETELITADPIISPEIEADDIGIAQDDELQLDNVEIKTDIEVKADFDSQIKEEDTYIDQDHTDSENFEPQFEVGIELEAAPEIEEEDIDVEFDSDTKIDSEADVQTSQQVDSIEQKSSVNEVQPDPATMETKEESQEPEPVQEKNKFSKSGASKLEQLPDGFRYCPNCEKLYTKQSNKIYCDDCSQIELKIVNKGLIPGHYLILYSCEKKPIAFFRLETDTSIYIGRANERGSLRDIDISLAWKNYYKKNASEKDLKEKMKSLKGVIKKSYIN